MSYSCTDFVDDILDALCISGPSSANEDHEEWNDSPSMQADDALAEIGRLQAIAGPMRFFYEVDGAATCVAVGRRA